MAKRRGKYAHIVDRLQKRVGSSKDSVTFRDKVNAIKRDYSASGAPMTGSSLAREVTRVRRLKGEAKKEMTLLEAEVQAFSELLVDQYELEGITSTSLEDGVTIRLETQPAAKTVDKDKVRDWVKKEDLERLLTVHASTLNSLVKERLLAAGDDPEAIMAVVTEFANAGIEIQGVTKVVARGIDDGGDDEDNE